MGETLVKMRKTISVWG